MHAKTVKREKQKKKLDKHNIATIKKKNSTTNIV
jgi:hypothetical protein